MPNSIISLPAPRARLVVLGLAVALTVSGCAQLKGRQGYVVDPLLTEAITPGVARRTTPKLQVAIMAGFMMTRSSLSSMTLNVSDWTEPFSASQ